MTAKAVSEEFFQFLTRFSRTVRVGLLGTGSHGLSLYDISKEAGGSVSSSRISQYRTSVRSHGVEKQPISLLWVNGELISAVRKNDTWIASIEDTQRFVSFLLRGSRKGQEEIEQICEKFGIQSSIFESAYYPCPEADTLDCLQRAFPYSMERQFRVGKYKLDGYFPSLRIAVCCDENNHEQYDQKEETEREEFIRDQLQCFSVHYNPMAPKFSVLDVIREVLAVMASPGYHKARVNQVEQTFLPEL